jgi:photosystem II stability/assembly factor-like uncharacterized protein
MKNLKRPFLSILIALPFFIYGQPFDQKLFDGLHWRCIGPHRGGRTVGAVGVPQQPNVFYIGVNNGGVWKTNDYGRTWKPIFDSQPTGSIGDIAVAPSNPNVIYVASGEGIQRPDLSVGDGIYKSTDGGKTWANMGLKDGLQIGGLAIDPKDENRVFVGVLGHPYGPNTERGVYRTTNGGKNWEKVYYKDENTGAIQVAIDPQNPLLVYADIWQARQGPWENGSWQGPNSGLIKSIDGGKTWKPINKGLPTFEQGLGRIGFCISPSQPWRLYATVDAAPQYGGIYRSEDSGESWTKVSGDARLWGRGSDFAEIKTDPKNPDIVYSANVVTWKSTDGGKTWSGFRGAPGGDDYHRMWINPDNPDIMLLGSDQGAIITVNGGETFSSWYNQPTAQFYHVSTDNAFPYNVLGGQQESGSVGIASRGNDGQITYREWHPVGVEEYGYVAADPLDPNIVYGGKITKFDKRTGQVQDISPQAVRDGKYRFLRTAPVLFSPIDPKTLYFAGNVLFKTNNGGNSWEVISPDLSREKYDDIPLSIGIYRNEDMKSMARRGVIYTIAPSPKDINVIWAGTDDGLVHITRDGGKNWDNVTPPDISAWSKISIIEASHSDLNTAYIAVNRIRLDDYTPHIYKTTDGGKSWKKIVNGLPNDPINTVKEDPERKGLLFAGSERAAYVSFDDGANWQSLRLNMPATSIRDLVIKDDDLVIGTHGRSFWILDNITPLRQLDARVAGSASIFYRPQSTYRVRWSMYTDTPVPQEEAAGQNPPDGAIFDYYLKQESQRPVTLEILNDKKQVIRKFSTDDKPYTIPDVNIPLYWIRPQQELSNKAGAHRFLWDLRYASLNIPASYPISAVYGQTAPTPSAPFVMPGDYTVRFTANGVSDVYILKIKMDPRIKTSNADLQRQHDLAISCYESRKQAAQTSNDLEKLRKQIKERLPNAKGILNTLLSELDQKAANMQNMTEGSNLGFNRITSGLANIHQTLTETDMPPTTQVEADLKMVQNAMGKLMESFATIINKDIKIINEQLKKAGMTEIII